MHHPDLLLPHDSKIDRDQFKIFATIESEFTKNDIEGNKPKDKCEKTEASVLNDESKVATGKKRSRSPSPCPGESSQAKKQVISSAEDEKKMSKIQRKLEAGAPYNFFLTKIKDCPETHGARDSLYITDLLHPSLGSLSSSLQINFMVDLDWLMMNYEVTRTKDRPPSWPRQTSGRCGRAAAPCGSSRGIRTGRITPR